MPDYLVDESGERTHAVVTVDEYQRLKDAEERLESVRDYALEVVSSLDEDPDDSAG